MNKLEKDRCIYGGQLTETIYKMILPLVNQRRIFNATSDYTSFHVENPNVLECKDKMINEI